MAEELETFDFVSATQQANDIREVWCFNTKREPAGSTSDAKIVIIWSRVSEIHNFIWAAKVTIQTWRIPK